MKQEKLKKELWGYTSTAKLPPGIMIEEIIELGHKVHGAEYNVIVSRIMAKFIDNTLKRE